MKGLCKHCGRKRTRPGERQCCRCYHRRRKKNDPVAYRFYNLKVHAKERGKDFHLTLEQFRRFCKNTGYTIGSGPGAYDLTIDRKDPTKGYDIDNIQVITRSENSTKGNTTDRDMIDALGEGPDEAPF